MSSKNVCCGGACMTRGSSNLIKWDNPKNSAIAFGSGLSALLLVKYVNIPSLIFYSLTLGLLLGSAVEFVGEKILGQSLIGVYVKPHLSKYQLGPLVEEYAPHFVTIFKKLEGKFIDLLTIKDINASFKAGVVSYVFYLLFKLVSLWNLSLIALILAFGIPPVYQSNKKLIDSNVNKYTEIAKEKSNEGLKTIETTLGPHLEKVKEIASPVIKMVESKLPVRTAGSTVDSKETVTSVAGTTSSSTSHAATNDIKKVSKKVEEENEVDFTALGEQLKKEADEKVLGTEPYSREKVDTKTV